MKSYLSIIVLSLTISFSSLLNASLLKAGTVALLTLWGAAAGTVSTPYVSKVLTRGVTHPLILKRLSSKSIEFVTASNLKLKLRSSLEMPLMLIGGVGAYFVVYKKI